MAFGVKYSQDLMGNQGFPVSSSGAEAVLQWSLHGGPGGRKNKNNKSSDEAKNNLSAMRWNFWYADKGGKKELRYTSPQGKVYCTLRTAYKACMNEGVLKDSCPESSDALQSRKKRRMEKSKNPEASKRGKTLKTLKKLRELQKCQKPNRVQVISVTSRCNLRVILSRLIEKKVVTPGAFVCYSGNLGEGWINSTGIKCKCCNKVFTMTDFEAHVGSKKRRPAANIFLEDGRSLLDCQKELLCNNKSKNGEEKFCDQTEDEHEDVSYDVCCVCHNGGELIICGSCRSTYHKSCLGLKDVPTGDWFCTSCCCVICGVAKFEKTMKNSLDDEILHTCDQCEHKFHMGCLRRRGEVKVKNYAHDNWFCSDRCEHTFTRLHKLSRMPISLGADNLTWRLLKYNKGLEENQRMLNDAIDVIHESFEPAVDPLTGKDLAEDVILNSKSEMKHKNYKGFYTAVVGRKGEIASVATVRVFDEVAEIPLVATRFKYRGQGMCRRLMGELERQLVEIGVMKLILPSAPSLLNTWTTKFGFSKMTECERLEYSNYTFLDFQDTIMCRKMLMKKPSLNLCQSGATWSSPTSVLFGGNCSERVVNQEQMKYWYFDEWKSIDGREILVKKSHHTTDHNELLMVSNPEKVEKLKAKEASFDINIVKISILH